MESRGAESGGTGPGPVKDLTAETRQSGAGRSGAIVVWISSEGFNKFKFSMIVSTIAPRPHRKDATSLSCERSIFVHNTASAQVAFRRR